MVEHILQLGIAARYRVAHDHQIGLWLQVGFTEGLRYRNIERRQELRHWRICRIVRASNVKASLL